MKSVKIALAIGLLKTLILTAWADPIRPPFSMRMRPYDPMIQNRVIETEGGLTLDQYKKDPAQPYDYENVTSLRLYARISYSGITVPFTRGMVLGFIAVDLSLKGNLSGVKEYNLSMSPVSISKDLWWKTHDEDETAVDDFRVSAELGNMIQESQSDTKLGSAFTITPIRLVVNGQKIISIRGGIKGLTNTGGAAGEFMFEALQLSFVKSAVDDRRHNPFSIFNFGGNLHVWNDFDWNNRPLKFSLNFGFYEYAGNDLLQSKEFLEVGVGLRKERKLYEALLRLSYDNFDRYYDSLVEEQQISGTGKSIELLIRSRFSKL